MDTAKTLSDYSDRGQLMRMADGDLIFSPGDECGSFLIVHDGAVRVEQTNSAGRTVVLYRVGGGDSCVLTTACLISNRPYSGFGFAEGSVTASSIAHAKFQSLMRADPDFQKLVFQSFAERVGELTSVIDDLLEHRTDLRLARWLAAWPEPKVELTQADIAQELGTAREVVSRALKTFEARGWIAYSRGRVSIKDSEALHRYGSTDRM